jgi:hypothetical protein
MPKGLRRFHSTGQRHFTPGSSPELPKACSCYRRQPFLASARRRDCFLKVFEQVREKYDLLVMGLRGHAGTLSHFNKRASKRKCSPRDAGVETASVESLPQKQETGRSDEIVGIGTFASILATALPRF